MNQNREQIRCCTLSKKEHTSLVSITIELHDVVKMSQKKFYEEFAMEQITKIDAIIFKS